MEYRDTVIRQIISDQQRQEELSERCRLLYVAMTRPRDRLIVTACVPDGDHPVWHLPAGDARVNEARSMLDWIMQPVCDEHPQPVTDVPSDLGYWTAVLDNSSVTESGQEAPDTEPVRQLLDALDRCQPPEGPFLWWDDPERPAMPPQKTSVTAWVHRNDADAVPDKGEDETPQTKCRPRPTSLMPEEAPRPAFME